MMANEEKKKGAAGKETKMRLPRHYEPKGLIWSVSDFIEEAQSKSRDQAKSLKKSQKNRVDVQIDDPAL